MRKKIINIFCLVLCLFALTGCSMLPEEQSGDKMNEKASTELQYIEDVVFNITNKYTKGEYIKDDTLDWDSILEDEKKINEVLETIILDLSEININKDDVALISTELNNLLMITINKNETELLTRIQTLYSLIPKCLEQFSNDKNEVKDKQLKLIVLSSYALANIDDWDGAKTMIQSALDKYNEMMNDVEYMQDESYKINKVYVLLGEVKNAIDMENLELTKLKFVNFIEKM